MIEESNGEVSNQVRDEEGPVLLRHRLRSVVKVVDGVDPHVSCIVKQVHRDPDVEGAHQILPVSCVERRSDRLLAKHAHLVQVASGRVVRFRCLKRVIDVPVFKAF